MSTTSGNQVIVKIIGGLGNQLFQYAAGRSLAERTGGELVLDISGFAHYDLHSYSLKHFAVVGRIATEKEIMQFAAYKPKKGRRHFLYNTFIANASRYVFETKYYVFDKTIGTFKPPLYVDGYWQSELYFKDHASIIRDDLQVRSSLSEQDRTLIADMRSTTSVSVHVRRGDYVHHRTISTFHGTCSPEYYHAGIAEIQKRAGNNLKLFVFSDDTAWAREHLSFAFPTVFVDHNDASKNYADMVLMSSCTHHIIANSSFSWWGAWLDVNPEKIVIAPSQWVLDPLANTKDLLPPTWIKI